VQSREIFQMPPHKNKIEVLNQLAKIFVDASKQAPE
jgi:hypothetical protein